jgi:hypothetical protein
MQDQKTIEVQYATSKGKKVENTTAAPITGLQAVGACNLSFAEFRRQNLTNPYMKEVNDPVDGINRLQLEERTGKSGEELVAEFRRNGQVAVHNRQNLPWILRKLRAPMGPVLGLTAIEYLLDTLYPRDQWMHRYDICAATGKKMVVTPEHDGRIVALVVRDIARKIQGQLGQRSVALQLAGEIGGEFVFGRPGAVDCTIEMDVFDFNLRASGRISAEEARKRTTIRGDQATGQWFLDIMEVVY